MESTPPTSRPPTSQHEHQVVSAQSLLAALAQVPDPRRRASVIYPLPAILALAMAEWGADQSPDLLRRLGFAEGQTPCQSTLQRLFVQLDARAVAAALCAVFDAPQERKRGEEGVALDGKAQRSRRTFGETASVVQVLTAFCAEQSVMLTEEPIEQHADKQEAELTAAPRVLEQIDWQCRVLTGDALYCQRDLCQQVLDRGGDYLLLVKANQRTLYEALLRVFTPSGRLLLDRREATTIDKGHGRIERRHLVATADLLAVPDWPGVAQVFRLERTWWTKGKKQQQVRYGITSLPPCVASAHGLLTRRRKHWSIENRGHRAKDVSLGDDASLIHKGQGPNVCSVLRNAALSLLHRAGYHAITSRLRYYAHHPEEAVALLLAPPPTRA